MSMLNRHRFRFILLVLVLVGAGLSGLSCVQRLCFTTTRQTPATMSARSPEVRCWTVSEHRPDDRPPVRFQFPPPVENYQGMVTRLRGELILGEGESLQNVSGFFEAAIADVTMGEPELDESIRGNVLFLYAGKYPTSKFLLRSIQSAYTHLEPDRNTPAQLQGSLELKGVSVPLTVPVQLRCVTLEPGRRVLHIAGSFWLESLRETFQIEGPGGEEEPAGNRLEFTLDLRLEPESTERHHLDAP